MQIQEIHERQSLESFSILNLAGFLSHGTDVLPENLLTDVTKNGMVEGSNACGYVHMFCL